MINESCVLSTSKNFAVSKTAYNTKSIVKKEAMSFSNLSLTLILLCLPWYMPDHRYRDTESVSTPYLQTAEICHRDEVLISGILQSAAFDSII